MQDDPLRTWTGDPRDSADFLAAIVRSSYDAIYSKDDKAIITSWNHAAERLYGYTSSEAIGRPISMLVPSDRRGEEIDILNEILAGNRIEHYETVRVRKDGSTVEVSVSVSPVHDRQGKVVEAAVIARNISERKRLEEEVKEQKRKEALELNDAVVQGLVATKMAIELDDIDGGLSTATQTLENAKEIVTRLLLGAGGIHAGDLTRDEPATLHEKREGQGQ
jgi:PAS domain S-box-containing protein